MYAVTQLFVALGYLLYVTSIAEIVSGFPFSGGCYGLARVAQGYHIGFLVGCCEALEYIGYSAMSFLYVGSLFCDIFGIDSQYSLVFCFLCYVIGVTITVSGGHVLLNTNYIIAVVSSVILLVFLIGTLPWTNFVENTSLHEHSRTADMSNWFSGGMAEFLSIIPPTTASYGGIEALCLLPALVKSPKTDIPKGLVLGVVALFVLNMLSMFIMSSMPGGIMTTSTLDYPMEVGFNLMFGKFPQYATIILMIPAQFGMGFGFLLPFGKLLQALGSTNLLPSVLGLNNCANHAKGVIVGSMFGFVLSCICQYTFSDQLANICILAGFLTYLSQLHGYWMLKTKYATSKREFISPFGLTGVAIASLIFVFGVIAIVGFSDDYVSPPFVFGLLVILSFYYHFFAARTQTIAKEEQAVLFQLHVAKGNKRRKHHHGGPSTGTTFFSKSKILSSVRPSQTTRAGSKAASSAAAQSSVVESGQLLGGADDNRSVTAGASIQGRGETEVELRSPQVPTHER